jgi:putative permease
MILSDRKNITKIQLLFFILIIVLCTSLVLALPRISIPLFLAYVLSLALTPVVSSLMALKMSKTLSIVLIFIFLGVLIGWPLMKIIPMLSNEAQNFQNIIPKIEQYIIQKFQYVQGIVKLRTGHEIDDTLVYNGLAELQRLSTDFVVKIPNYLANLVEWMFLVPFFTFFIIRDSDRFKKTLLNFTPNLIFERTYHVTHIFNRQLGDYFFAKFVEAVIVGGIITTGLLLLDIKFAVILGFIAGFTNIVPYVGPFLGIIPTLILGMLEYGMTSSTMYFVANVVDIFFVFPFLVSKVVNLHPVIVAVSVIIGSHYFGITGMVISIPVVAAIKLIITEIYNEIYTERSK